VKRISQKRNLQNSTRTARRERESLADQLTRREPDYSEPDDDANDDTEEDLDFYCSHTPARPYSALAHRGIQRIPYASGYETPTVEN